MSRDPEPAAGTGAPPRRRHWKRWLILGVAIVIVAPLAFGGLWAFIALHYTYSHGHRAGYVQKFSKKGWICPTWEGELAMVNVPGAMQERWEFSVRSDSIADVIAHSMGNRVSLTYDQHKGVPTSCFGETEYYIDSVQVLGQ